MLLLLALFQAPVDYTAQIKDEVARQECRPSGGAADELVVCGRRQEGDRYRVTEEFAPTPLDRQRPNAVRRRAMSMEEGGSGTNSCTNIGPGGWTGCMQQRWKKARQQKKGWYGL